MAAADPRGAHPSSRPEAVIFYRLVGIGGAGRQVPALAADQAGKADLIEPDQRMGGPARRQPERVHDAGLTILLSGSGRCAAAI